MKQNKRNYMLLVGFGQPEESEMTFERAMHLLKLSEIYGDPPKEITLLEE